MNQKLSELIDLVYENEEVESLAIADLDGGIIENQLILTTESASVVAKTVSSLYHSLTAGKRSLNGLMFKTGSLILQVCIFETCIVLVQLDPRASANETEKNIRSVFGSFSLPATSIGKPESGKNTSTENDPSDHTKEESLEGHINFQDFYSVFTALLKRVAPNGEAEKLINEKFFHLEIDVELTETIFKEDALLLGREIINKIHDEGSRSIALVQLMVASRSLKSL